MKRAKKVKEPNVGRENTMAASGVVCGLSQMRCFCWIRFTVDGSLIGSW